MSKHGMIESNEHMDHHHMHGVNGEMIKHGHEHGQSGHTMLMWFHFGCHETILFEFWHIESLYGLLLSCVLIFIMASFYEWIKWFRVNLQLSSAKCPPSCRHANDEGKISEVKQDEEKRVDCTLSSVTTLRITQPSGYQQVSRRVTKGKISPAVRFVQAILYLLQLTLAYCLMLIAMTYNVWLTLAVILGAAFGHWLFAILNCFNPQTDDLDTFATDACH